MSGIHLLLSDAHGIYIPHQFANFVATLEHPDGWHNVTFEECQILTDGPEHEEYWDVWCDVLDNATYTDASGNIWRLYQDGDLFAFCESLMTDEEYENFYGEPRYE